MTETVLIHNPESGTAEHGQRLQRAVSDAGYDIRETDAMGDAIPLAARAVDSGYTTIVAAGGDGTVNEVVRGIDRADGLSAVTLGIVPLGTGNNFARQLGITDLETAFRVLETGRRRRIDLGQANSRPFVNSCVAGLTAESSGETSAELKSQWGVLAYVLTTLRSLSEFDSLRITIDPQGGDPKTESWAGEATCVLVGNGRRFAAAGGGQADMEDGQLEIVVVKDVSAVDLMSDRVTERLFGTDSEHIIRSKASALTITNHERAERRFSLDGEMIQEREITLAVRPASLSVAVGDEYDPTPE
jgi:YegS/Rv2252/BmrU family lipid kinase